jgi:hypothetical protein
MISARSLELPGFSPFAAEFRRVHQLLRPSRQPDRRPHEHNTSLVPEFRRTRPPRTVEYMAVTPPEPDRPENPTGERGVFGNLPSERPGVRSPRRDGTKRAPAAGTKQAKADTSKPGAGARSSPATSSQPRTAPPKPSPPPRVESPEPPPLAAAPQESDTSRRGIEDVAWAGVTVAAEAATLGVRLFSRALEAVRERR